MNLDLTGKTAIVTATLLNAGAAVTALYAGNRAAAAALETEFKGLPLETVAADVADYAAVEAFFRDFDARHARLDILVNNAGIRRDNALAMMPADDWNAVIATNLTGSFNMSKFAAARMSSNRWGRIVCVTSASGRIGIAGQSNYAAAKAGQTAMVKSLSKEVARRNITVNCVSPGYTDTELLADLSPEQRKAYADSVPLRRFATVEEVADTVLFLVSDSAAYITGQTIEISGGI